MSVHTPAGRNASVGAAVGGHVGGYGRTHRADRWWTSAVFTVVVLLGFAVYATWAAFQGRHYEAGPYLSPFYSPLLFTNVAGEGASHSWFGAWPSWWPSFLPASPALLILVFPGAFRFTCYYYRKAYYRAFAGSPPACAVGTLANTEYRGETRFLLFQNLHRYAMYFALPYIPILYYDAYRALNYHGEWGIGVGTIIMFLNATLLAGYTLGCHALRHMVGGHSDCMSCGKNTLQLQAWKRSTRLNVNHQNFAWASLFSVALTDVYIRLCSMGVITDLNTW